MTNGSNRKCDLVVSNDAPVLREKDILTEKDATTPCSRIYFAIQLMYIDNENRKIHADNYWQLVGELIEAVPILTGLIDRISENIVNSRYYQALKLASDLIEYEEEVVRHVR